MIAIFVPALLVLAGFLLGLLVGRLAWGSSSTIAGRSAPPPGSPGRPHADDADDRDLDEDRLPQWQGWRVISNDRPSTQRAARRRGSGEGPTVVLRASAPTTGPPTAG